MLKVGYYQFRPIFGNRDLNLTRVIRVLHQVNADLIVLPELTFTGYYFKDRDEVRALAENPKESFAIESLVGLCKQRDLYLVTGFAETAGDKIFNSALLLGPEGIVHTYRKLHLFNEEKNWFDSGDIPLQVQEIRGVKIGLMICFDWLFPEVTRTLAVLGADIICHPANLVLDFCQQAMLTHCLENHVFAITANRFGTDKRPQGELRFTGKSQIVAPKGKLLNRAVSQRENLFVVQIEPESARDKSITPLNQIMNDRRPEFYSSLTEK